MRLPYSFINQSFEVETAAASTMAGPEEGSGKQEAEEALKRAEALSLSGDEQDEEARRGDAATLLRRIRVRHCATSLCSSLVGARHASL
jgi:hypothetical protein